MALHVHARRLEWRVKLADFFRICEVSLKWHNSITLPFNLKSQDAPGIFHTNVEDLTNKENDPLVALQHAPTQPRAQDLNKENDPLVALQHARAQVLPPTQVREMPETSESEDSLSPSSSQMTNQSLTPREALSSQMTNQSLTPREALSFQSSYDSNGSLGKRPRQ